MKIGGAMFVGGQSATDGGAVRSASVSLTRTQISLPVVGQKTEYTTVRKGSDERAWGARTGPSLLLRADTVGNPGATGTGSPSWLLRYQRWLVLIDLLTAVVVVGVAYVLRFDRVGLGPIDHQTDLLAAALLPVAWVIVVAAHRGYEGRFIGAGSIEFQRMFRAFVALTLLVSFVLYAAKAEVSRGFLLFALPPLLVVGCVARYTARKHLHRVRAHGGAMTPVMAIGSARAVAQLTNQLRTDPHAGLTVVGACLPVLDPIDADILDGVGIPAVGSINAVPAAVRRCGARSVVVLSGEVEADELRWISWQLEGSDTDLIVAPGIVEVGGRRLHIHPVAGLPLLHVDVPRFTGGQRMVKSAFDRAVAGLALIVLIPVFLAITVLVRITSPGPAFFRQTRVGRDGKTFTMIKFRSMCSGAEQQLDELMQHNVADGPLFKLRADPRVTRIGQVLRKLSLDELPQLLNVIGGSMSLVGPRPPLPAEVALYGDDVRRRLLVKPGITGLWQISGRSDLSWDESVRLDLRYVENWSLAADLMILWKTAFAVVHRSGAY
jgi:exopolysaccharide biosynthesis polyprenyl glycosylphosphotransferase